MNVVILSGRIAQDLELKQTMSNVSFVRFSIAVDRPYRSGEEKQTDFINCVAWRSTAETLCKWKKKGEPIEVEGALQVSRYQDKDGNNRTSTDVLVNKIHFVAGGKRSDNTTDGATPIGDYTPANKEDGDDLPF